MIRKSVVLAVLTLTMAAFALGPAPARPAARPTAADASAAYIRIDRAALLGRDPTARDAEIRRILASPDRFAPIAFAPMSRALYLAGRADEARTWYFRGRLRMLVDIEFSYAEFGVPSLGDAIAFYDEALAPGVGSSDKFSTFMESSSAQANDRAIDEALDWDEATPREYPLGWLLGHSIDAYAGRKPDGSLKPGWEARLKDARGALRAKVAVARRGAAQASEAEAARASAAAAGVAAAEAASNDPKFASVAKPLRTIDLNGCVALPGQPMDDEGKTLLVRCPDFARVELATGRVLQTWSVADLGRRSHCESGLRYWPPGDTESYPPDLTYEFAASARHDSVIAACDQSQGGRLKGNAAALQLPLMVSSRGSPFAPLVVDATGSGIDPAQTAIASRMNLSADGRWLLLTADAASSRFGLLVDLDSRKARALHPEDAPMQGLSHRYSGYFDGVLISEPAAVVAQTHRPSPKDDDGDSAYTVVIWPVEGGPARGVDLNRWVDIRGVATPQDRGALLDRGVLPLAHAVCGGGVCGGPNSNPPPNQAPGFKAARFDGESGWLDPRDLWTGTTPEAEARYAAGSGPIHCETTVAGHVILTRRWAIGPLATRDMAHSGPVWCAMNTAGRRLVVGVGRYAHVYEIGAE